MRVILSLFLRSAFLIGLLFHFAQNVIDFTGRDVALYLLVSLLITQPSNRCGQLGAFFARIAKQPSPCELGCC
jgi:hypothetical protein